MRADLEVNSFNVNTDVRIDFKSRTDLFPGQNGQQGWVLVNLEIGMCQTGYSQSWDGGLTYCWSFTGNYAVRESKHGLQWYDQNGCNGWRFFDDAVQEAYAQFALEKEIK